MPPIRRIERAHRRATIGEELRTIVTAEAVSGPPISTTSAIVPLAEVNTSSVPATDSNPQAVPRRNSKMIAQKRIMVDMEVFLNDPLKNCTIKPHENNIFFWDATIEGPPDTPYEGGIFRLNIMFPEDYPFVPPMVVFKTSVYHCNICVAGNVCMDVLRNKWTPALSATTILLSLQVLLAEPNPEDPMQPNVAALFMQDRRMHDVVARRWTKHYATAEVLE